MINHENFKRMASRLSDNELDDTGKTLLSAHLSECAECRAFAHDLGIVKNGLAGFETETPSRELDGFLLEKAYQAVAPRLTLWERVLAALPALKPAMAYATAALLIGALAGGAGFKLSHRSFEEPTHEFLSESEAGLFDAVYPGSISEVLKEVKKEKL